nr:class I SAM-dependent methyltransferase [Bacteroidota bacterium]
MKKLKKLKKLKELLIFALNHPGRFIRELVHNQFTNLGNNFASNWEPGFTIQKTPNSKSKKKDILSHSPLQDIFYSHTTGKIIWKWEHYLNIYHRHFSKFIGKHVKVLEIGVYGGGSLEMWTKYFGHDCQVYGVDIDPSCQKHAKENIRIFTGDQEDRNFWKSFLEKEDGFDIIIDDGGHQYNQQIVTLEMLLPKLRSGGIYVCEDIISKQNHFISYALGLIRNLNEFGEPTASNDRITSPFQNDIASIHFYPFIMIIEKHVNPIKLF